jgi:hypothetical protein
MHIWYIKTYILYCSYKFRLHLRHLQGALLQNSKLSKICGNKMQQIIFIADIIACSTCFGHQYANHQELESIIQVGAAYGIWCFGFRVVGMVWS